MDKFIFICPHTHCPSFFVCEEDRNAVCEVHQTLLLSISDPGPLLTRIKSLGELCEGQLLQLKGMVEVVKQKAEETDAALFKLNNVYETPAGDFIRLAVRKGAMGLVKAFLTLIDERQEGSGEVFSALHQKLTK